MKQKRFEVGAQVVVSRRTWPLVVAILAAGLFLLLAVQAFFAANPTLIPESYRSAALWKLKILEVNDALALFFAALSLLAIHQQARLNSRPYVVAISGSHAESQLGLLKPPVWSVVAKNVGPGVAIIQSARFEIAADQDLLDFAGLTAWLQQQSINSDAMCVSRISTGTAIGSDAELALCEAEPAIIVPLTMLNLQLEYKSSLGEKFVRVISLLPAH